MYPAVVGGAAVLAAVAVRRDVPALAILPGVQALAILVAAGLERAWPFRRDWLGSRGDVRTDLAHLVFSTGAVFALRWLAVAAVVALAGTRALAVAAWPNSWPLAAQVALVLGLQGLVEYGLHRAFHVVPVLWRFHAVHHSAPRVYWLNQWRLHPFEGLVDGLAIAPAAILGAPAPVLVVFAAMHGAHLVLQHANIDLRLGALGQIVSMSEAHRWHHSPVMAESNGNYGGFLLIWDLLFGTHVAPAGRVAPDDAGLGRPFPTGYLAQLAAPFRRGSES